MAELDTIINEPSESEKRIKQLSDKVRTSSEEREAEKARADAAEAKMAEAQRSADFSDKFSDIVATNPAAKDFKEDIKAKVMSGYTPEDAAYAVLGKAGKLAQPKTEETAIAGGSATNPSPKGDKSVSEMTQAERHAKLEEILTLT